MIPSEQLWTGERNRRALEEDRRGLDGGAPERVGLYDTTLRDGVTDEEFRELVNAG